MDIISPKFEKLLQEVDEATQSGLVAWEEGLDEDSYRIAKPYGTLEITREVNAFPLGGITYSAQLFDRGGSAVESAMSVDGGRSAPSESFPHAALFKSIFEGAARRVHGSEGVLDRMLAEFSGPRR